MDSFPVWNGVYSKKAGNEICEAYRAFFSPEKAHVSRLPVLLDPI